ncbi:zinc finger protein 723-like [Periplaneta americana]|uniref:zinc finger protein 723-like n=1 Tax=Periplaneta americana TaxID=6978 RepID=UPI0037E80939
MDGIKIEPEFDPLAVQTSDNTDIEEKKPSSEELNFLEHHVTAIKEEYVDHGRDLTSKMEAPATIVKYEPEEDLDIVNDELKLEAMTEENEILTESLAETPDGATSSERDGIAHEEYVNVYEDQKNSFSSEKLLHSRKDEKRFKCDMCEMCFPFPSALEKHKRKHTGEKPFNCNFCAKSFSQWGNLMSHKRMHSGEKPFKCDVCGKYFSFNSHLKDHLRTHTGEKPFQCGICGKCFSRKTHLKSHIRTHTGEKPFKCGICGKTCSRKIHLESHMCTHTGEKPFKCDVCGKYFSLSRTLRDHKVLHATTGQSYYLFLVAN